MRHLPFHLISLLSLSGCLDIVHNDNLDEAHTRALVAPTRHNDVAIVLGCPAEEDTGAPSDCERCKVKSALRAYRNGEVGAIIFSGGAAHNRFVEAEVMGELARERGLPDADNLPEPRALTTWMNLRFARRIMRAHGWRSALLVSTASHIPRVDRFARWFGIDATYRACDWDLPHDSDEEWRGPLRRSTATHGDRQQ